MTLFDDEAGTDGAWAPVPVDIDAFDGAKPLFDEACPSATSRRSRIKPLPGVGAYRI